MRVPAGAVDGQIMRSSGASLLSQGEWRSLACREGSAGTDVTEALFAGLCCTLDDPQPGHMTVFSLLQLVAGLFIVVGAILGIIGWTEIPRVRRILLAHMIIGLILLTLVVLQVSIALGRPSPKTNLRYGSFRMSKHMFACGAWPTLAASTICWSM